MKTTEEIIAFLLKEKSKLSVEIDDKNKKNEPSNKHEHENNFIVKVLNFITNG